MVKWKDVYYFPAGTTDALYGPWVPKKEAEKRLRALKAELKKKDEQIINIRTVAKTVWDDVKYKKSLVELSRLLDIIREDAPTEAPKPSGDKCPRCDGMGEIPCVGLFGRTIPKPCPNCNGTYKKPKPE